MNDPIIEKFIEIQKEIAAERGDFVLFAVLEREESPGRWDVVLAAPWFGEDKNPARSYIIGKMDSKLSRKERETLSRVVLLNPSDEFVRRVNQRFAVGNGTIERVTQMTLADVYVTDGYILKSMPKAA